MLNNREAASLFWLGLIFALAMLKPEVRSGFRAVVRTASQPAIFVLLALFAAYGAFEVWFASKVGLWRATLTKDTAVWAITSGIVLVFNFATASRDPVFFRKTLAATLTFTVAVEFLLNFFVFSLPVEFIIQPFVAFVGILSIVAGRDEKHRPVKRLADSLSAIFGFVVLGFVLRQVYLRWREFDLQALLEFVLPVWMTIGLSPFVYAVGLFAAYDSIWREINRTTSDRRIRRATRLAAFTKLHLRLRDAHAFRWKWIHDAVAAGGFAAARRVVGSFRDFRRGQSRAAAARTERFRKYAGSDEVDEHGRRLDRREFDGTVEAFRLIAACQAGQFRMQGRYRSDLLKIIGDDFTRHGLPKDAGIAIEIAENGKAWYAWRRTITGWCFAVGGTAGASDEWEYDGADPPRGFPRKQAEHRLEEGSQLRHRHKLGAHAAAIAAVSLLTRMLSDVALEPGVCEAVLTARHRNRISSAGEPDQVFSMTGG